MSDRPQEDDESVAGERPVALVLIEARFRPVSRAELAQAVSRALGQPYLEAEVKEDAPHRWRLVVEGYEFSFLSIDHPYLPQDGRPSPVPQLREIVDRQQAAVLLDAWDAPKGHRREDGTGLMGRLLVELLGEHSLGVYCFHAQRLNPVDATLTAMFRRGQALEAMGMETYKRVSWVSGDDPRIRAAIAEARQHWPEFVRAFAARTPGSDGYGVKARFGEDGQYEHLWIEVEVADEDGTSGTVLNGPLYLLRPRKGERVRIALEDLSDWAYLDDDRRGGGFSRDAMS